MARRDRLAKLVVLYKTPKNTEAFDKHYSSAHFPLAKKPLAKKPLAKKIPGLMNYNISTGTVAAPAGPSGIHFVAPLYFDSLNAIKAALRSPQGQAAAGDFANADFRARQIGQQANRAPELATDAADRAEDG